jgi:PAS domain-containing protein
MCPLNIKHKTIYKVENELAKSEINLKTIINSLDAIILLLDINYNFIAVNDEFCKITNRKR